MVEFIRMINCFNTTPDLFGTLDSATVKHLWSPALCPIFSKLPRRSCKRLSFLSSSGKGSLVTGDVRLIPVYYYTTARVSFDMRTYSMLPAISDPMCLGHACMLNTNSSTVCSLLNVAVCTPSPVMNVHCRTNQWLTAWSNSSSSLRWKVVTQCVHLVVILAILGKDNVIATYIASVNVNVGHIVFLFTLMSWKPRPWVKGAASCYAELRPLAVQGSAGSHRVLIYLMPRKDSPLVKGTARCCAELRPLPV